MQQHNLVFKSKDEIVYPCETFSVPSFDHTKVGTHKNSSGMLEKTPCSLCKQCGFVEKSTLTCFPCLKKQKVHDLKITAENALLAHDSRWARSTAYDLGGLHVYGAVFPGCAHLKFANSKKNDYLGLTMRSLKAGPKPRPKLWKEMTKWILEPNNFSLLFEDWERIIPIAFKKWNKHFPKSTRTANEKAYEYLMTTMPTEREARRAAIYKMFIKAEKTDKCTLFGPDETAAPRPIHACSPVASVATGLWFRSFQTYLHKTWSKNIMFSAGCNLEDLSSWFNKFSAAAQIILEDDFTMYETTFSVFAHNLVIKIFEKAGLGMYPWAHLIRKEQVNAAGFSRSGYKYQVPGTMSSGVADTCLSNSMINAISHLFALHKTNPELNMKELLDKFRMSVMGDDNLMLLTGLRIASDETSVEEILRQLGFMPKLQVRRCPEEVVYLNNRPYKVDGQYHFGPRIGRLLARLGYSVDNQPHPQAYVREVALAFRKSCNHIPILRTLIDRTLIVTKPPDLPVFYTNLWQVARDLANKLNVPLVAVLLPRQVFVSRIRDNFNPYLEWRDAVAKNSGFLQSCDQVLTDFPDPTYPVLIYAPPSSGKTTHSRAFKSLDTDNFRNVRMKDPFADIGQRFSLNLFLKSARHLLDSQKSHTKVESEWERKNIPHATRSYDADESTFQFVSEIYGLSRTEIDECEAKLSCLTQFPALIFDKVMERVIAKDM
jgi:hypothetical protein